MASAPKPQLPMLYNDLLPVSKKDHAKWHVKPLTVAKTAAGQNAIPLTSDEFVMAGRHFPIVFSAGDRPVPLALMGLNEGQNVAIDDKGEMNPNFYYPAYIRRYPFLLAKITPERDELSLCFDPSSKAVGKFKDGDAMFDGEEPSDALKSVMGFCEQFEEAGARTQQFVQIVKDSDLLMDGEVSITAPDFDKPFVYRGFQMVNEEKLRDMRGDDLRKLNQNGALPLIYAHLFSLQLTRDIFGKQREQGWKPVAGDIDTPAEA